MGCTTVVVGLMKSSIRLPKLLFDSFSITDCDSLVVVVVVTLVIDERLFNAAVFGVVISVEFELGESRSIILIFLIIIIMILIISNHHDDSSICRFCLYILLFMNSEYIDDIRC